MIVRENKLKITKMFISSEKFFPLLPTKSNIPPPHSIGHYLPQAKKKKKFNKKNPLVIVKYLSSLLRAQTLLKKIIKKETIPPPT